jgi:hypothetical protein
MSRAFLRWSHGQNGLDTITARELEDILGAVTDGEMPVYVNGRPVTQVAVTDRRSRFGPWCRIDSPPAPFGPRRRDEERVAQ